MVGTLYPSSAVDSAAVSALTRLRSTLTGFGGIFGVGQAAIDPPRLVILKYEPAGATKTVALAGKVRSTPPDGESLFIFVFFVVLTTIPWFTGDCL